MTAKELRAAGLLWPQTLTDEELGEELDIYTADRAPISWQMLNEERAVRGRKKGLAPKSVT